MVIFYIPLCFYLDSKHIYPCILPDHFKHILSIFLIPAIPLDILTIPEHSHGIPYLLRTIPASIRRGLFSRGPNGERENECLDPFVNKSYNSYWKNDIKRQNIVIIQGFMTTFSSWVQEVRINAALMIWFKRIPSLYFKIPFPGSNKFGMNRYII